MFSCGARSSVKTVAREGHRQNMLGGRELDKAVAASTSPVRIGDSVSQPWVETGIVQNKVLSPLLLDLVSALWTLTSNTSANSMRTTLSSTRKPTCKHSINAVHAWGLRWRFAFGVSPTKSAVTTARCILAASLAARPQLGELGVALSPILSRRPTLTSTANKTKSSQGIWGHPKLDTAYRGSRSSKSHKPGDSPSVWHHVSHWLDGATNEVVNATAQVDASLRVQRRFPRHCDLVLWFMAVWSTCVAGTDCLNCTSSQFLRCVLGDSQCLNSCPRCEAKTYSSSYWPSSERLASQVVWSRTSSNMALLHALLLLRRLPPPPVQCFVP